MIILVVRKRTGTGLTGVSSSTSSATGGVSIVAHLALLAVLSPGVVSAVLLLGDGALGRVKMTEVIHNNMGGEDDLGQRLKLDTLPGQGVTGVGVAIAVALLTDGAPHVPPGGEVAGAAELTRGPRVTLRTLADLHTEGGVLSLVS